MTMATPRVRAADYRHISMLSAWGFAMVFSSFLFRYAGYWLDEILQTPPAFMLGLFLLGLFVCIGRLYREAWLKKGWDTGDRVQGKETTKTTK